MPDLYNGKPAVKARLEKAARYAVFSNLNVKSFILGSGQEYGMAVDNASKKTVYMKAYLALARSLGYRAIYHV